MYKIKTKRIEKAEFSSIVTWLDDGHSRFGTENSKLQTMAFMGYNENIRTKIGLSGGDAEQVIHQLTKEFRKDYDHVINHLLNITTLEDVTEMLQIVETFIRVSVVKNEILLLKDHN
ncbi:hypothetical protein ACSBL2_14880 [Pedobacter sp. AW31-3R]|uniref:hypothetical protein n=1 Tax=Pedobacter sp. AW31-3R TaxID=3445781 RepID=UPI003F9F6595